jgi:hypothetical protein
MAAWLFIAAITIVAWLFGVAVGEGDARPRASISRRSRHGCTTEVSLDSIMARDLGIARKGINAGRTGSRAISNESVDVRLATVASLV